MGSEDTDTRVDGVEHEPMDERRVLTLLEAGRLDEANQLFDRRLWAPLPEGDRQAVAGTLIFRAVAAWRLGRTPLALELAADGWTELDAVLSDSRPGAPAGDSGFHGGAAVDGLGAVGHGAYGSGPYGAGAYGAGGYGAGPPIRSAEAAQAVGRLGYLLDCVGRRGEALRMARRSVELARLSGDTDVIAHCLQRLGGGLNIIAADSDEPEPLFREALGHLEEGLTLVRDPRIHRSLLGALANALAGLGELGRAEEVATRTLELSEEADFGWGVCVGLWVLAAVRRRRGRAAEARELLLRAAEVAEHMADSMHMRSVGMELAAVGRELGDPATEVAALRYVLAAVQRCSDTLREGLGQALEQRRLAVQAHRRELAAQQAAARDPLTGLGNRLGLQQSAPVLLDSALAARRAPWLILLDVDHFKRVNDVAGHPTGDAVLCQLAGLLRRECRTGDLVARWAGDEFVVLLTADPADPVAGATVAERIRSAAAGLDWSLPGSLPGPTVSIGVSTGPADLDVLFTQADAALYRAKRLGRNRVEVAAPA
ncbi:MAG TPA: GGDEF domain-containing protein [Pseudonocardiaceae bacterium]